MNSDQWATWWADVGGQVFAGVVVLVIAGVLAALTPWGKRVRGRVGDDFSAALRFVRSLRLTTQQRIDTKVAEALAQAAEPDPDDAEGRPLGTDDYDGWVMERAPEPRTWLIRNQTGDVAILESLMMGVNSSFEFTYPALPVTLADGESISFPARRIRSGTSFLPFFDSPTANVVWEDSHGDQQEDVVWIVTTG